MPYRPIIAHDEVGRPYLYCPLGGLPEVEQERLKDELEKTIERYQTSHQRTEDWLKKAEDLNQRWRQEHNLEASLK